MFQALANKAFTIDVLANLAADVKTPDLLSCQLPIINTPTSLSGGEYPPNGGATDMRTHRKSSFAHASMGAQLVILDPALSVSIPEQIWISIGMRAKETQRICIQRNAVQLVLESGNSAAVGNETSRRIRKTLLAIYAIRKLNWSGGNGDR